MPITGKGLLNQPIDETPIAIFDFETTGLNPGVDRVVEVSVIRIDPGKDPKLIIDTMINPDRKMAATEIHGITEKDVKDAPKFEEITGDFLRSICDCVIASYNIYFDIGFLKYEFNQIGLEQIPPHLCLMYMRPLLNLGCRCSLEDACKENGIKYQNAHQSINDAQSAAELWGAYQTAINKQDLKVFGDLANLKSYKFLKSLISDPFRSSVADRFTPIKHMKSRTIIYEEASQAITKQNALHSYWESLKTILADLQITKEEMTYIKHKKKELHLSQEEIRAMHARAFGSMISQFAEDKILDDAECKSLKQLYGCLDKLGWAPGR